MEFQWTNYLYQLDYKDLCEENEGWENHVEEENDHEKKWIWHMKREKKHRRHSS